MYKSHLPKIQSREHVSLCFKQGANQRSGFMVRQMNHILRVSVGNISISVGKFYFLANFNCHRDSLG